MHIRRSIAAAGFLVGLPRREPAHLLADQVIEEFLVAHEGPDLVVPAPDGDAGMMPDAHDLVLEFRLHVVHELPVETGIRHIGKLELFHHRDAQFIAGVEERVVLVKSAAPEPEEIEIARRRVLHVRAQHLWRDPRQQIVGGNPIRSLGEERLPVDFQSVRRFPRARDRLELPQPDPFPDRIEHVPPGIDQLHLHGVEVLLPQSVRPPEFGLRDAQRERRRQSRDRLPDRRAFLQQARGDLAARGGGPAASAVRSSRTEPSGPWCWTTARFASRES